MRKAFCSFVCRCSAQNLFFMQNDVIYEQLKHHYENHFFNIINGVINLHILLYLNT